MVTPDAGYIVRWAVVWHDQTNFGILLPQQDFLRSKKCYMYIKHVEKREKNIEKSKLTF